MLKRVQHDVWFVTGSRFPEGEELISRKGAKMSVLHGHHLV